MDYNSCMAAMAEHTSIDSITLSGLPMPIALRLPVLLSDEELIAFSRSIRPYQVERNANGELEIMSPNDLKGASLEAYAMRALGNWAADYGGVVISSQGGFTLADNSVRMADASWISATRWSAMTSREREGFARLSPDFLIEIRSKSDSLSKLQAKMEMWMANGAQLAWMIDPYAGGVSIYRPGVAVETLLRPASIEADGPVAGFRLAMVEVWESV
jgi:Uma2 family endonuclease